MRPDMCRSEQSPGLWACPSPRPHGLRTGRAVRYGRLALCGIASGCGVCACRAGPACRQAGRRCHPSRGVHGLTTTMAAGPPWPAGRGRRAAPAQDLAAGNYGVYTSFIGPTARGIPAHGIAMGSEMPCVRAGLKARHKSDAYRPTRSIAGCTGPSALIRYGRLQAPWRCHGLVCVGPSARHRHVPSEMCTHRSCRQAGRHYAPSRGVHGLTTTMAAGPPWPATSGRPPRR
jgi:hypothetical protein